MKILLLLFSLSCSAEIIYIIGGSGVRETSQKKEVRDLFLGRSSEIIVADNMVLQEKFQNNFLFMSQYKINQIWAKLVFTGKRMAKNKLHGDHEVNAWVRSTPKGISYVKRVTSGNKIILKIDTN